jgi:CheY-like chemotaxis protein
MGPNGKSRLVLIVEDEGLLRAIIADEFRTAGWEVIETDTAEDAVALMRAGRPVDIVFTDIQLAGRLTGWDVGERCRAIREDVAIIYASGTAVDRSRRVDGSLFFDKPYIAETVIEACHKLT